MIHISFGIDDKFVMPCGVTMTSICENNKLEDITFHLLVAPEFMEKSREALRKIAVDKYGKKIEFHNVSVDLLKDCPLDQKATNGKISTYFRFLLPLILPDLDKVIYLDSDLVIRGALVDFWNIDLTGVAIGACPDECGDDIREFNRLQYDCSIGKFNAGVLILNLEYWRSHNVLNRLFEFAAYHPGLPGQDQDCLNVVLRNEKKTLDIRYNLQENLLVPLGRILISRHRFDELEEAIKNPCIIHYTNSIKPWFSDCEHPFCNVWRKYLAMTGWKNIKLEPRYPKAKYIRMVRNILAHYNFCQPYKSKFRVDLPTLE